MNLTIYLTLAEEREGSLILKRLCKSFGWRCVYCGTPVYLGAYNPTDEATLDHVIPLSVGGVDSAENSVLSCLRCNRMKADLTAKEFISARPALCKFAIEHPHVKLLLGGNPQPKPQLPFEESDEPGLLRKVTMERERISWAWRNPF